MSRPRGVAVTGIGLTTPAGVGTETGWRALCAGVSTATADPRLAGMPVTFSCRVPDGALEAAVGRRLGWRLDRFIQLALVTSREAVRDAGLDPAAWEGERVGVVIGVGSGSHDTCVETYTHLAQERYRAVSPTTIPRSSPNMAAGEVGIDLKAFGPNFCVSTACASGATALGTAKALVESGVCDIVIAGGSESAPSSPMAVAAFWRMGALSVRNDDPAAASRPFDADRDGFVLGEGAGILVLERLEHARARGARVHALLTGYGASADAHHPTMPHPDGEGATRAASAALADACLTPRDIGHVNAHGTGTRLNDLTEARMLRRVFGTPPAVTATKGALGHAIGGAGAIEAVCCVLAVRRQVIHPTVNLDRLDPEIDLDVVRGEPRPCRLEAAASFSFGFGGQNACLVFTRP
ncbi:beta-ketoacyl synthase [Streptomyces sp. UNOC14_S4]|uniref:beta-ketoacyl-[acyl-carrier-protein] synthase family protein n=1 Tax=Streptomyces sp. UNOC14_S4 TaxID=2872340 RepID=UPI001E4C1F1A|nr:beta-ketoacyl-[acyl-carrier-protein] synthase family protein [Streptomyces sp. UNOC14_S4]MCC3766193.1 beta-ketoacyl-[acyl-carrier-protein] synthase family protein [Streptomyces sp. UNOC14_S4]